MPQGLTEEGPSAPGRPRMGVAVRRGRGGRLPQRPLRRGGPERGSPAPPRDSDRRRCCDRRRRWPVRRWSVQYEEWGMGRRLGGIGRDLFRERPRRRRELVGHPAWPGPIELRLVHRLRRGRERELLLPRGRLRLHRETIERRGQGGRGHANQSTGFAQAPPGTYSVTFTQTEPASGASWTVGFNSHYQTGYGSSIVFAGVVNGTYSLSVNASGYRATPALGGVTVAGADQTQSIDFSSTGPARYDELSRPLPRERSSERNPLGGRALHQRRRHFGVQLHLARPERDGRQLHLDRVHDRHSRLRPEPICRGVRRGRSSRVDPRTVRLPSRGPSGDVHAILLLPRRGLRHPERDQLERNVRGFDAHEHGVRHRLRRAQRGLLLHHLLPRRACRSARKRSAHRGRTRRPRGAVDGSTGGVRGVLSFHRSPLHLGRRTGRGLGDSGAADPPRARGPSPPAESAASGARFGWPSTPVPNAHGARGESERNYKRKRRSSSVQGCRLPEERRGSWPHPRSVVYVRNR